MQRVAFDEREQFIISHGTDACESRSRVGAATEVDQASEERFNMRFVICAGKARPGWGGVCQLGHDFGLEDSLECTGRQAVLS
jgi:hypothetical protein